MRLQILIVSLMLALISGSSLAQTRTLTFGDYGRAEKFLGYNTNPLVLHAGVRATWLPDDRFWYRTTTENGTEIVLIDPARGTRNPAFNQAKLNEALSSASGTKYEPFRLPFTTFTFEDDHTISFNIAGKRW